MSKRVPGSHRTREALRELMEGHRSESFGRTELVQLVTRLIIEEGLEAEVRDALDRGYYEHGAQPGGGYRNGLRQGRLKTAEGFIDYAAPQVAGTAEPFRSELREHLKGHSEALESLAIEMPARGLSVRDIEDAFKDEIHAYADHVVIRQDGEVVGEHVRRFGRDQTVYDPWHYVPVLARKPGALRNGAPFKQWALPPALERVRRRLAGHADGDRQMVGILAAVISDGLDAVEAACAEALAEGAVSRDVVLNILTRRRQPPAPDAIATPEALQLRHEPLADCARYDSLRRPHGTARDSGDDEGAEARRHAPGL